jgi:hypothetical protein
MSFDAILIGWCAASVLTGGSLVVWFVMELKFLNTWLLALRRRRHRHRRRHCYELPRARAVDKRRLNVAHISAWLGATRRCVAARTNVAMVIGPPGRGQRRASLQR